MLKVFAVLSLAAVCLGTPLWVHPKNANLLPPIVGGEDANIEDYPWQLAFFSGGGFCGAVIISNEWVLTAAHCTIGTSVGAMSLRAGSSNYNSGGSVHDVVKKIEHPNYRRLSHDYDYTLLQVDPPFEFGPGVAAIPLIDAGIDLPAGTKTLVSGWGTLHPNDNTLPLRLQAVEIPLTSEAECRAAYGTTLTDRMICAGLSEGGVDSCQGDSGGPIVSDGILIGVVSFGNSCALPNYPGVYSSVSNQRDWIRETSGV